MSLKYFNITLNISVFRLSVSIFNNYKRNQDIEACINESNVSCQMKFNVTSEITWVGQGIKKLSSNMFFYSIRNVEVVITVFTVEKREFLKPIP